MSEPLVFLLAVLTLLGTPGPTNTLLATAGAYVGLQRSLRLLIAELSGYLLAILIIRHTLGLLVANNPALGASFRIVAAFYLLFVASRLWRARAYPVNRRQIDFRSVFLMTLSNPKAFVFALNIIPIGHPNEEFYFIGFAGCVLCAGLLWVWLGNLARGKYADRIGTIASFTLTVFAGIMIYSAFRILP